MSTTVSNDCLDNFETNRDQDLGKAIAEAASALSHIGKSESRQQLDALMEAEKSKRNKKSTIDQT